MKPNKTRNTTRGKTTQPDKVGPVAAIAELNKSGTTPESPRSKARIESDEDDSCDAGDDDTDTAFGAPAAAMVHDLVGFALIALPAGLRPLIGDDALRSSALELEHLEVLVIVRETGVVAYVHLPILVMEMEGSNKNLQDGGLILKVISAHKSESTPVPATPKPKAKSTASAKATKPAGKAGRHA